MNQISQDKLRILASDELMIKAIEELFNERIEKEKPIVNIADTDDLLGQKFRAYEEARKILLGVLVDINIYKDKKVESKQFRKER